MRITVLLLSLFISSQTIAEPQAYEAKYVLLQDGDKVGTAKRILVKEKDNLWRMQTKSTARLYFVKVKYDQESIFEWKNNTARPLIYKQISDTSLSSKRLLNQEFNWRTNIDSGNYKGKAWSQPLQPSSHDRLTAIITFREMLKASSSPIKDAEFLVNYRGKATVEKFQLEKQETITTPAGEFLAYKYFKSHANTKRKSYYWFAPELDYFAIRIQQFNAGEEQANMLLKSVN